MFGQNPRQTQKSSKNPQNVPADVLRGALDAWQSNEANAAREELSPGARANVLALSRSERVDDQPLSSLFVPFRRWISVAAVPALALALSFTWLIGTGNLAGPRKATDLRVDVSKVNGEAVFAIANGGQVHRVYKSSSPGEIGTTELYTTTTEAFRDRLSDDAQVVFYRID